MPKFSSRLRQIFNGLRYLARGDFLGLANRLKWYGQEYSHAKLHRRIANGNGKVWGILCTPHTLFIAKIIADRLAFHGIESEIMMGSVKSFNHDFYIVLCAQMFKQLPPANKRVIFQLEQSVSSRWFTKEYIKELNISLGVLDYSLTNIEFLSKNKIKYPNVYYLPIGVSQDIAPMGDKVSKKYDFIFYGDVLSSERRRRFLDKLQEKYSVKICNNLFGNELYAAIRQAKAVINIHYYENALLEMPRLCESISLCVPVLSEGTVDQIEYPELDGAVKFFDEGSIDSMMAHASDLLNNIETVNKNINDAALLSAARFNFMFDRFLVGIGVMPVNIIIDEPIYLAHESNFFALSLPETIERRRTVSKYLPDGCELFDGIRHSLGWVGCGSSYSALARYSLNNKKNRVAIIEDDVELPDDFSSIFNEVNEYLDNRKDRWDIFSGLMADIHPNAKILSVENVNGRTYVTMDKVMSAVFNIYNKNALELISLWNPLDTDAVTNTIDRYLERQENLRVVVALPFVVGHKEDLESTLWGFKNVRYNSMIAETQRKIEELAQDWVTSSKLT